MKAAVCSIVAAVVTLMLVSCNSGGPKANAEKWLNGFWHMDYAMAKDVSTERTRKQLEHFESYSPLVQAHVRAEAKKIGFVINEPVVNGDHATVEYTLTGIDDKEPKSLKMVRQNGKWLVEWTKLDPGGHSGGLLHPLLPPPPPPLADTPAVPAAEGTPHGGPSDTTLLQR